jgi:hypothetical protein
MFPKKKLNNKINKKFGIEVIEAKLLMEWMQGEIVNRGMK